MRTGNWRGFLLWSLVLAKATASVPLATGVWPDGDIPLALEFSVGAPGLASKWEDAALRAVQAWNPHLERVQLRVVPSANEPLYDNERNELFFSPQMYDEAFPEGVLAFTMITTSDAGIIEADVVFNAGRSWAVYDGPFRGGTYDFRRVALHELGHVLGLGHPDEAGQEVEAVMNSEAGDVDAVTVDDRTGVHGLYDWRQSAPPTILEQPEETMVKQGQEILLWVGAGGRGPMSYFWEKSGRRIPESDRTYLFIEAARLDDAGDYSVTVSNAGGAATSAVARVVVEPAEPPHIDAPTRETVDLLVGESGAIGYSVKGDTPMAYEWRKNGQLVEGGDSSFSIDDAQFSNAGDYTLTVTNVAGTATSSPIHVKVSPAVPLRITHHPWSQACTIGQEVNLSVDLEGARNYTCQWRRDGVAIPGADRPQFRIAEFRESDRGSYTVEVRNATGAVESEPAVLSVRGAAPPVILVHPSSVEEAPGASVSFAVIVEGERPAYRWFKDGVPLSVGSSSLYVNGIDAEAAGEYVVEVTTAGGVVRSRPARLRVFSPPAPYILLHPSPHRVTAGQAVELSVMPSRWFAGDFQDYDAVGYTYQWYRNGHPVPGANRASLEFVADASRAGHYFVRVTAPGGFTDSEEVEVEFLTGLPALLPVHPPSQWFDRSNREALRLSAVAFEVWLRRVARASGSMGSYLWQQDGVPVDSPFGVNLRPGEYTIVVSNGERTETSTPFTLGFQPVRAPIIYRHPASAAVDLGQEIRLDFATTEGETVSRQWWKDGQKIPGANGHFYVIPAASPADVGHYHVTVANEAGTVASDVAEIALRPSGGPQILYQSGSVAGSPGYTARLAVRAAGGELRYQWHRNGQPVPGADEDELTLQSVDERSAGSYTVVVSNGTSSVTSRPATVRVWGSRGATILQGPQDQTAPLGGEAIFTVTADGEPLPTGYQWFKNGVAIAGATDARLRLTAVTVADAGQYSVRVSNAHGAANSAPGELTVDRRGRLVNLSTRAQVGTGGDILIAGFVISGTRPHALLVRGIGGQLAEFALSGVLRNPRLKIFDAQQREVTGNDDWQSASDSFETAQLSETLGAFAMTPEHRDAALVTTLPPGSYTVQVSGVAATKGLGLVEVYEVDRAGDRRLANLSSRVFVAGGAKLAIAGFVLEGELPRRVLIRGIGPSLDQFGLSGSIEDPRITLFRGEHHVAANDDWMGQDNADEISRVAAEVGAFALEPNSRDSALLVSLDPGLYTVHVENSSAASGPALVEVYEVP